MLKHLWYVFCLCVDAVFIRSDHYNLIGVDVRKEQEVEATLSGAGLQWDAPTLVLSEVVLTYMETQWWECEFNLNCYDCAPELLSLGAYSIDWALSLACNVSWSHCYSVFLIAFFYFYYKERPYQLLSKQTSSFWTCNLWFSQVRCCDWLGFQVTPPICVCDVWTDPPRWPVWQDNAEPLPEAQFYHTRSQTISRHCCSDAEIHTEGMPQINISYPFLFFVIIGIM